MHGMSYFKKIFLMLAVTTLISSSLLIFINVLRNYREMERIAEQTLSSGASQKEKLFEMYIEGVNNLSASIANDVEIKNHFVEQTKGNINTEFKNQLRENLRIELESKPDILESCFFTFQNNVYVDGLSPEMEGFDISDQEWHSEMLREKEPYLGEVSISPNTGLPVMGSNYPILDENGEVVSIFVLTINLNVFSEKVVENEADSNQKTILVNKEGIVIASKNKEDILVKNLANDIPLLYKSFSTPDSDVVFYEENGVGYIAKVEKTLNNLYLIQSLPVYTYQEPLSMSVLISIGIMVMVFLAAMAVAFRVAKNITRPVNILVAEMEEMSSGNYTSLSSGVLRKRNDEFAKLGHALETLRVQTRSLIENLQKAKEQAEQSLMETIAMENQTKAIIKALPDLVFVVDGDGVVLNCQTGNDKELLHESEAYIGKNVDDFLPPNISKKTKKMLKLVINQGDMQQFEFAFNAGGGKKVYEIRIVKSDENKVVVIARNTTEQKAYLERIEFLSFRDQLTSLYNRRYFEEELERMNQPEYFPLCILIADVNGLKLINDSFGHQVGDELLIQTSNILKKHCEDIGAISRIGGDEFIVMLPKIDENEIEKIVNNIRQDCEKTVISSVNISLSMGWEIKRKKEEDISEIFNKAEDYMYHQKLHDSPSMRGKTIHAIINALYEKNKREEEHSRRVSEYAGRLAQACNLLNREVDEIKTAGLLHDIGKIAVDEYLLNKPGKLTTSEFEEVAKHPEIGYRILSAVNNMADIAEFVLHHHERWDGKGYPDGIAKEEIELQARMIAIADAFDAMISYRSYKEPFSKEQAAKEILDNAGSQFDPKLAEVFVKEVLKMDPNQI